MWDGEWNLARPGNRTRDRPKRRWLNCVANDMQNVGVVSEDVYNRERQRKTVSATVTPNRSGNSPLRGGGALAILCVLGLGMFRPQGYVFHNFCRGRVLFSGPTVWQGVCFDPGLTVKFWQGLWFYLSFLGRVGNVCLGRVRVCHPGLHTPIHNLVKSPPGGTAIYGKTEKVGVCAGPVRSTVLVTAIDDVIRKRSHLHHQGHWYHNARHSL